MDVLCHLRVLLIERIERVAKSVKTDDTLTDLTLASFPRVKKKNSAQRDVWPNVLFIEYVPGIGCKLL